MNSPGYAPNFYYRQPIPLPRNFRPVPLKRTPPSMKKPVPAPRLTVPKQKKDSFELGEIFNDIIMSVKTSLNKPEVLLTALVVGAIIVAISDDFPNSVIGKWAANNPNNSFAKWILINYVKMFGMLIFLPVCLDLPQSFKWFAYIVCIIWCYLVPQHSIYEYLIQAAALHTYFKVKLATTRIFLIFIVFITYVMGFLTFTNGKLGINRIYTNSTD